MPYAGCHIAYLREVSYYIARTDEERHAHHEPKLQDNVKNKDMQRQEQKRAPPIHERRGKQARFAIGAVQEEFVENRAPTTVSHSVVARVLGTQEHKTAIKHVIKTNALNKHGEH